MYSQNRRRDRRSGQVLIMFTLALVPMFGIMGLVTDIGYMHFIKMSAQTAAQAAASAAIIDIKSTAAGYFVTSADPTTCAQNITTPTSSLDKGCMYAENHGFNSTNQWVTYQSGSSSTPPTASGMGTASYWVTFRVYQKVPQLFSAVLGNTSGTVVARSTAALTGASDCIYALNKTASGAVTTSGSTNVTSSCGIYVNSSSASALTTNGGANLQATEYDVAGNVNTQSPLTPTPNTGVPQISDPLGSLPVPATGPYTCTATNYSAGNGATVTLSPGVYCGGINVRNNTFILQTGTYIIVGGGLTTQSTNSTLKVEDGGGVLIYNTYGIGSGTSYSYAPVSIAAGSTVTLKAQNTGTYADILYFEDRTIASNTYTDDFGGNSSSIFQGTIYASKSALKMHGTAAAGATNTILVADTINIVGNDTFNNDYSQLPSGSPIQKIVVVE
jgi:Flp pilus assembly protein TadG